MGPMSVITNLGGGRALVSPAQSEQCFVEDESGQRTEVTREEAARLRQEAKSVQLPKRKIQPAGKTQKAASDRKPKTRSKRKSKKSRPIPLDREELEAAAAYELTTESKEWARFAALDLDFAAKVQLRADELEEFLHRFCDGRDPRDRTPEIWINIYKCEAQRYRDKVGK